MEEPRQANFGGWALVEIMGHRRAAGMVTTEYIGQAAFLRIVTPEVPPTRITLEKDCWLNSGARAYAGSIVEMSREKAECYVGSASVYALTPLTEDQVLEHAPLKQDLIQMAERRMIDSPTPISDEFEYSTDDSDREEP